ncbi:hypothetical protein AGABI2DRAFT_63154 [Agaricus bisporus var. bisporus H97]|uniref:hypothetical protein n=1 Tax=Agaricus bisporus var. bisporus (strain H97 / ATCC MYA-4626 / FGSC 10389) TaxID=936046 RepID=UPI00029F550F|nr:hypothetical protein AGABI2DRAFT_63154 [Agaricus bisporus var. bisporus H97]EKV50188.1 hypothetical protein AGABI2DRAFT_63154 [Agaricus bisporus var. bisporus H97]
MSNDPSRNVGYDPLPLTTEDSRSHALYNAPPSPDPNLSTFQFSEMRANDPSSSATNLPAGAGTPRFLGPALYDDPALRPRDSFASSAYQTADSQPASVYTSSVYALNEQSPRFDGRYRDDPNDTNFDQGPNAVLMSPIGQSKMLEEKRAVYAAPAAKSRKKLIILAALAVLVIVALAIIIPIYFTLIRPKSEAEPSQDHDDDNKPTTNKPGKPENRIVTGGDGSEVTMEDGTKFTYRNSFGGYWYYDEEDPFNNGARAQSWSPALNETFHYGTDKIKGVNVGGWLLPEPVLKFVVPGLFEKYHSTSSPPVDEWTLSEAMRADTGSGGINQLEDHYKTFITEKDFAEIAGAGLNYVRIPIGYWAVEARDNEPFLAHVSWQYFLKAIRWARKYGLRINIDLHALPGSQNGWNHSGRLGTIGLLNGPMGFANAQRSLDIIRVIAEFISQPQYRDVVSMFGFINEPQGSVVGQEALSSFYLEAYKIIRTAGGTGEGNGPFATIHDAFFPRDRWAGIFPNADRMALDSHPYLCFGPQSDSPMSSYQKTPCSNWGSSVNNSMANFGLSVAGEFSNAVTDCGLWLNGVDLGTRYEGTYIDSPERIGDCAIWTDWTKYDDKMKADIKNFALASMDALQDYFFWTWKIGNSSASGKVECPAWSYQLGLEQGWMPKDPREAAGACGNISPWQPPLNAWQTGGAGAGDIPATVSNVYPWPPATLSHAGAVSLLPSYTETGPIPTLPAPTLTAPSGSTATPTVDVGNGWNNPSDNAGIAAEISGCSYLDPWVDPSVAPPLPCSAASPVITPPPA